MSIPYYLVAVRYREGAEGLSSWEPHTGFYTRDEAEEERQDFLQQPDAGMARIVKIKTDGQAAIDAAIASMNGQK